MNWESFFALLKRHPGKTVMGVLVILGAGSTFGSWMLHAEQSHAQAQSNEQVIEQLLEYQKREIQREELEAKEQQRKREYITKLCLSEKLKDKDECAKVGVKID